MKLQRFKSHGDNALREGSITYAAGDKKKSKGDPIITFYYVGNEEYTLNVDYSNKTFELLSDSYGTINMSFDDFINNKEEILILEPTVKDGELLVKWIGRALGVAEWDSSSIVSNWKKYESDSAESNDDDTHGFSYNLNTSDGIYVVNVMTDMYTFHLLLPDDDVPRIDTIEGLTSNSEFYKSLGQNEQVYSWIQYCFGNALLQSRNKKSLTEPRLIIPITTSSNTYFIDFDTKSNYGCIHIPTRLEYFQLDKLYLVLPELPFLDKGELNKALRKAFESNGLTLPETPYELGFYVSE